jgi:predicted acetyltransferase
MNIFLERVEILKKNILANLLQLYLHDITSENFSGIEMDEKGLYPYPIDGYFGNDECIPYFIKLDTEIVGFVLIEKPYLVLEKENDSYCISEMFIMNKYKRKGIGKNVALQLFKKHIGKWEIGTLPNSKEVTLFWENVVSEYTHYKYTATYLGNCTTPVITFGNYEIEK